VCDLMYLNEMMGGKKHLIKGILDAFLKQAPQELHSLNEAVIKNDYVTIKNFAHTMKSSVSIMGISTLTPILLEMEDLGAAKEGSDKYGSRDEKIKELTRRLNIICKQAIAEVEKEKHNYI